MNLVSLPQSLSKSNAELTIEWIWWTIYRRPPCMWWPFIDKKARSSWELFIPTKGKSKNNKDQTIQISTTPLMRRFKLLDKITMIIWHIFNVIHHKIVLLTLVTLYSSKKTRIVKYLRGDNHPKEPKKEVVYTFDLVVIKYIGMNVAFIKSRGWQLWWSSTERDSRLKVWSLPNMEKREQIHIDLRNFEEVIFFRVDKW